MKHTPAWFQYPHFNWKQKKAVIIGGGIAGAQIAWHLNALGWKITLIERHQQLATEASGNPVGVISPKMTAIPSDGEDFYTQGFHYTLSQLDTLDKQGQSIQWKSCGVLQLTHNAREEKRWHALKKRTFSHDFIQFLNEKETLEAANIKLHSSQQYKSSYFPKGAWVKPASFVQALTRSENCHIIYHSEAIQLNKAKTKWQVKDKQQKTIAEAEVIIIANGKDLSHFEQTRFLPTMPVAGQTTSAFASDFSRQLKTVIGHEGYLTPAIDNRHTFGATFDRNSVDITLKASADTDNQEQLTRYLPELAASIETIRPAHAAVRMTTPDRFPYAGALPDKVFYTTAYHDLHQGKQWKPYPHAKYQPGLFVFGGFGSRGLTTSGLCAKNLANLINNTLDLDSDNIMLKHCHPARFLIKQLKRDLCTR